MIIYRITNTINGKVYIGQTIKPANRRWIEHRNNDRDTPLSRSIRKHGRDKFLFEVICSALEPGYLNDLEKHFIEKHKCMAPNGYNLTTGGDSAYKRSDLTKLKQRLAKIGNKVSEETRLKISLSLKGRPGVRKGAVLSEETRKKISLAQIGKKQSLESNRKRSISMKIRLAKKPERSVAQIQALNEMHAANKGRVPWNKGRSENRKTVLLKLSQSHRGRRANNRKMVLCVEIGKEYPSVLDAARDLGLTSPRISDVCLGKRKHTGGFTFRYLD